MEDVTDVAFRIMCKQFGADLVYSEFLSADALIRQVAGTFRKMAIFNLVPPTRTGWTFVGWTGSNGSVPQTTVTVPQGSTGDLNYTAHWSANAYTITFNPNGGVNPTIPSNLAGYNVTDLPLDVNLTPTRLGYTFKGWTGHGLPGTPDPFRIENTTPGVPGNLTFTATWDLNNYTLHYHLNGGVHVPGNPSTYNVTQLPVDIDRDRKSVV